MPTPRRTFTPEEKARIVLDILKEEKSVSQIASEAGIHANVLNSWKNEATQNLSQLFVGDRKGITKTKKRMRTADRRTLRRGGQAHLLNYRGSKKSGR
ncbi:transposase-like protein [Paenibacillus silagei]|uniref:Transposase-like protein n=1 Tax=Paenibacillus silagei TaxID=1670801 RepID=A0ABS4NXE0_9BACL|nr:transposase-like protein [Paenibacillus silagei]